MYTEERIKEIVRPIADKCSSGLDLQCVPDSYNEKFHREYDKYFDRLPEFNPIYREAVRQNDIISVHSEGRFPFAILRSKAPNQSDVEFSYQMGLYEPYSKSTWGKAKNKTKIIANDQNYSISGWDEEQKKYFFEDYPYYHSVEAFFMDIVRERKIDYPNQLLLIRPEYIPGDYNEEGIFVPDQSVLINPIVEIIEEIYLIDYRDNDYALILSEEKSRLANGGEGLIFYFYDKNNIWEIRQTGFDDKGPVFDYLLIYVHKYGWLPAKKLGGKPKMHKKGRVLYESCFADAVPDLNDVLRMGSNLAISEYTCAFPTRIRRVDTCKYTTEEGKACDGGYVFSQGKHIQCPTCKGTGHSAPLSPSGEITVVAKDAAGNDNPLTIDQIMKYVAPDTATLSHLDKRILAKMKAAFSFIFETKESTSPTATEVLEEKEEFHSFLIHFSNELFELLKFAIETIGFMRYGTAFQMPQIRKPTYFNFRTVADITAEIKVARESNMPDPYLAGLMKEAIKARFNTNNYTEKVTLISFLVDRLWSKTPLEVRGIVGRTCTEQEAIVHDSITTFIAQSVEEDETFLEKDIEVIRTTIFDKAQEIVDTLKTSQTSAANTVIQNAA